MSVEFSVSLGERSYPIYIGQNLLSDVGFLQGIVAERSVAIVSNETVAPLYMDALVKALGDRVKIKVLLPDGEQYKTLDTLSRIFDQLLGAQCDRSTLLIALGGGVVGDVAGFAAACYQRGIAFMQVPTTLLAQVDSSVGGKTAVNHPSGKNMIGAFYQPEAVIIDVDTLSSLDDRELRAGLAEVIKYGLIRDEAFFSWLEENIDRLLARDADALVYAIERSCRNKAEVVAADELEHGERALLNLGHTFGHAIETATDYSSWLHGEAIAVGMLMAMVFSERVGLLGQEQRQRAENLIKRAGLPLIPPSELDAQTFVKHMRHDKKVLNGTIRLILMRKIGEAFVSSDYDEDRLLLEINSILDIHK
ncbi:MAG: 3-dehydroquinate synthase [Proteobacteria bacterium]|jgi:3-dehydroquinate synthase|nr:3-dehydroquinate synthase [Pseudomonadota bacterium]